jgi:hypothetical protein
VKDEHFALRPLATGELLDRAFLVVRRHFKQLFLVALAFQLVNFVLAEAWELLSLAKFPLLIKPNFSLQGQPTTGEVGGQVLWACGAILFFSGASIGVWQLAIASLSAPPGRQPGSAPVNPGEVLGQLTKRLPRLLATLLLELWMLAFFTAMGAVPGVLAVLVGARMNNLAGLVLGLGGIVLGSLVALGVFLVVLLRYVLVPQVVVVEDLSGWAALARSSALMRGRSGQRFLELPKIRGSVLLLVIGLVSNAFVLVATIPRLALMFASPDGINHPNSALSLFTKLLSMLGESLATPFGLLVMVLFYLDLRVRREGVDLELAADQLANAGRV